MSDERPPSLLTPTEWRRPAVRIGLGSAHRLLLVLLVLVGLGPILWLAKSAITPTNDTITHPMGLFTHGAAWSNRPGGDAAVLDQGAPRECRRDHADGHRHGR